MFSFALLLLTRERKKISSNNIGQKLFLRPFFILEQTCIHFASIQAQRLILTQTLKLHCPASFTVAERDNRSLLACLSVSINSPQAAMLHASSSIDIVQILHVVLCQMHRNCILIASHSLLSTREIRDFLSSYRPFLHA